MRAYPKMGAVVWVLVQSLPYVEAVPVKVIGVDWLTGCVTLRPNGWEGKELHRKPGYFYGTKEEAEEAAVRVFGTRTRWAEVQGAQLSLSQAGKEGHG